ncbi:MAG: molybdopterin molybdotransferase MoeA [Bacteroidetes bacterium]|nr:molybdopterin molybdotransferase MoeA [Bacteroidota bacterium]
MTTFEEAYNIVIESAKPLETENAPIESALNRVLASDVYSDMDMPPFNKSAMDGYACRREDLANELEVLEIIAAGEMPREIIGINQCSKIMTGARVPKGADVVIMVEQTENTGKNKIKFTGTNTFNNIAYKAEDIKKNELILKKGTLLKPQHIALLASVGCCNPCVSRQARVAVISTGDEIVEPFEIPGPSQIRNSNAYQIISQVKEINAIPVYMGIAKDDLEITEAIILKAFAECDVVIVTGGVSMGDFDFVPSLLKKNNIKLLFEKLDVKPGRPTIFGTSENKYIFCLPGNPVSSYIMFEMLTKPLLYELSGHHYQPANIYMTLGQTYSRKKTDRLIFAPVIFNKNGELEFTEYHGSAHVNSLCNADGIIVIPIGVSEIKKGEMVHVRQI